MASEVIEAQLNKTTQIEMLTKMASMASEVTEVNYVPKRLACRRVQRAARMAFSNISSMPK